MLALFAKCNLFFIFSLQIIVDNSHAAGELSNVPVAVHASGRLATLVELRIWIECLL